MSLALTLNGNADAQRCEEGLEKTAQLARSETVAWVATGQTADEAEARRTRRERRTAAESRLTAARSAARHQHQRGVRRCSAAHTASPRRACSERDPGSRV